MKKLLMVLTLSLNAPAFAAWTPPIGIPVPPFGIDEVAPAVPSPWTASTPGFYYVQEGGNCSDTTHGNGFPGNARCTIPGRDGNPLSAGSVVEVHGTYTTGHESPNDFHGNGTVAAPIFIRGTSPAAKPVFTESFSITGSHYVVFENIEVQAGLGVTDKNGQRYDSDHIAIRNCDVHAGGTQVAVYGPTVLSNIVFYNNQIHDNGDWLLGTPGHPCDGAGQPICDQDAHGTAIGTAPGSGGNVSYVWMVDNTYYHNSGDGIQINGDTPASLHHIFIGRNVSHHNKQSGMWTKSATDVIFSQNTVYSIVPSASSAMGPGMGWQYEPANVWFLYNHISDTYSGIGSGSSNDTNPAYKEPVFLIGNVIHGIHAAAGAWCNKSGVDGWCGAGINMIGGKENWAINNTVYDVDSGIFSAGPVPVHLYNNIVSNVTQARGFHALVDFADRNLWDIRNNLFYENGSDARIQVQTATNVPGLQSGYSSKASANLTADPQFVDMANDDVHLTAGSPAVDSAMDLNSILWNGVPLATAYKNRYGVDLTVDAECVARPQGSGLDRGSYEYNPGGAAGVCPIGNPIIGGGPLPAPTLHLPAYLTLNSQVRVSYPPNVPIQGFLWVFVPASYTAGVPSHTSAILANASANARSLVASKSKVAGTLDQSTGVVYFGSQGAVASLASEQLSLGAYTVYVAALDMSSQPSPFAQANVTFVNSINLDSVRVYPNPWRANRHAATPYITIDNLAPNSHIQIFTVSGHWVKDLPDSSNSTTWDLTTNSGSKAASGIYLYLIKTDDGQKKTGQLHLIK